MRFETPLALLLLLALPALWYAQRRLRRRAGVVRFSSLGAAAIAPVTVRSRLARGLAWAGLLGLALLVVALARPQTGVSETRISTEGVAMMMVVDRSGSMDEGMVFDGAMTSRMEVAKRVSSEFLLGNRHGLEGRPDDLIGLVAFAGFPETVCPLVRSREALDALVARLTTAQMRFEAGTAIGDALALAAARLKQAEEDVARHRTSDAARRNEFVIRSKVIVLLTDGRSNAGELSPEQAAQRAAEWGIKIYAIGIGGGSGGRTIRFGNQQYALPGPTDTFDEAAMRTVAETTGGKFFAAGDAEALRKVYAEIDRLEKTKVEHTEFMQYTERFDLPAIAGAALIALQALLGRDVASEGAVMRLGRAPVAARAVAGAGPGAGDRVRRAPAAGGAAAVH